MALAVFAAGCAALVATDPHAALGVEPRSVRGWRVEGGHVGESLEIPAPGKVTVLDFWSTSTGAAGCASTSTDRPATSSGSSGR